MTRRGYGNDKLRPADLGRLKRVMPAGAREAII
jgi:hypothetical protein